MGICHSFITGDFNNYLILYNIELLYQAIRRGYSNRYKNKYLKPNVS